MKIVGAFACSHSGLIVTRAAQAPAAVKTRLFASFRSMGDALLALKPDAIVMIGTDHGRIFPLEHVSQYTLGVGPEARSLGDAGLPAETVPIHQPFAQAILYALIESGFDIAYAEAMRIDHSIIAPLALALGDARLPIVPILQNCFAPPLPTLKRSYEFGQGLGAAIRGGPEGRVALVGTGGLSHWVGTERFQDFMRSPAGTRLARKPEFPMELSDTGYVNEAFDRDFLALFEAGKAREFLARWTDERIYAEAGNGAQEVRNWLAVAGAMNDAPTRTIDYGAVAEWLTGTAIAQFQPGDNP